MWSRTRTILAVLMLAVACPAAAQDFYRAEPYGPAYRGADGYAGEFVRGAYIGAPLTRVPRPSQIVPTPWSYGTYGIPTVAGIPGTPAGRPTLTIINAGRSNASSRASEDSSVADGAAGARVIEVRVPRR